MRLFSKNAINSTYCMECHLKPSRIQIFFRVKADTVTPLAYYTGASHKKAKSLAEPTDKIHNRSGPRLPASPQTPIPHDKNVTFVPYCHIVDKNRISADKDSALTKNIEIRITSWF